MTVTKVADDLYLIDVEGAAQKKVTASYVLKGDLTAIIETGPAASINVLLRGLEALKVDYAKVRYIAASHVHLDHAGGVGKLLEYLPNAQVIVHHRGAFHLSNPEKLWHQSIEVLGELAKRYGKPEPVPAAKIIEADEGLRLNLGRGAKLEVIETTGHASHHLSFFHPSSQGIFPGDAAGIYVEEVERVFPTTPPPFRLDLALASLQKLIRLKPKVLYYSHFGPARNALHQLVSYEHQLKLWADVVNRGIDNEEPFEKIRARIWQADVMLQASKEYLVTRPLLRQIVVDESVQGIIQYVRTRGGLPNPYL